MGSIEGCVCRVWILEPCRNDSGSALLLRLDPSVPPRTCLHDPGLISACWSPKPDETKCKKKKRKKWKSCLRVDKWNLRVMSSCCSCFVCVCESEKQIRMRGEWEKAVLSLVFYSAIALTHPNIPSSSHSFTSRPYPSAPSGSQLSPGGSGAAFSLFGGQEAEGALRCEQVNSCDLSPLPLFPLHSQHKFNADLLYCRHHCLHCWAKSEVVFKVFTPLPEYLIPI